MNCDIFTLFPEMTWNKAHTWCYNSNPPHLGIMNNNDATAGGNFPKKINMGHFLNVILGLTGVDPYFSVLSVLKYNA